MRTAACARQVGLKHARLAPCESASYSAYCQAEHGNACCPSALLPSGNSGGPLLDSSGAMIGINTGGETGRGQPGVAAVLENITPACQQRCLQINALAASVLNSLSAQQTMHAQPSTLLILNLYYTYTSTILILAPSHSACAPPSQPTCPVQPSTHTPRTARAWALPSRWTWSRAAWSRQALAQVVFRVVFTLLRSRGAASFWSWFR